MKKGEKEGGERKQGKARQRKKKSSATIQFIVKMLTFLGLFVEYTSTLIAHFAKPKHGKYSYAGKCPIHISV